MHIGILQTGHVAAALRAEFPDYDEIFTRFLDGFGLRFSVYPVVDGVFPESARAHDGWLLTGSRHGAYEDLPWIAPLEELIRQAYAAHVPLVGICFGHQIIAQALGGRVEKFQGGWAVGRQVYDFAEGGQLALEAWHQDQVTERPADARVIASNAFCRNAALVYGDRAWTIQPHPEFPPDFMTGLIEKRGRGVVPDTLLEEAAGHTGQPLDTAVVAHRIAQFFLQPRERHV